MNKDVLFEAPVLSVADVWEDVIVIRVEMIILTTHGRPARWEVVTECDGGESKTITKFVPLTGKIMNIRMGSLPQHANCVVRVRGVDSDGNVGAWGRVEQQLLPLVTLSQGIVEQEYLNLNWVFQDWFCPIADIVTRFELRVASTEKEVGTKQSFLVGSDDNIHSSYGSARVSLPPSPFDNRMHVVQMRCFSGRHQIWSNWSRTHRFFSLQPLQISLQRISEESMTVVWGRYEGQKVSWPESRIQEEDVGVSLFRVSVWQAVKSCGSMPNRSQSEDHHVISIESPQLHLQEKNTTLVRGLRANTVYNVKIAWVNACGGCEQEKFFRFVTSPLPQLHKIAKVGSHFIDVEWFLPKRCSVDDLDMYINDDQTRQYSPEKPTPGGLYKTDKPYQHVVAPEALQIPLMHMVKAVNNSKIASCVEIAHDAINYYQKCRVKGLAPGTPYVISARTGGAAHPDVAEGLGLERAQWGEWTHSVLVTTLNDVHVQIEQRGHNFIDISWKVPAVPPIMGIHPEVLRLVSLDDQSTSKLKLLQDTTTQNVDLMELLIDVEELDELNLNYSVTDPTRLSGEGETMWCVDNRKSDTLQHHNVYSSGVCKFSSLVPERKYRLSWNVCDAEGTWAGRKSILLTTLSSTTVVAERLGDVYIDERFHIEYQDLPPVGNTGEGKMHYQAVINDDRTAELKRLASINLARVGHIALLPEVEMLGHDHAILHWKGFTPGPTNHESIATGNQTVVNMIVQGDTSGSDLTNAEPSSPTSKLQRSSKPVYQSVLQPENREEHVETPADTFNRSVRLFEYRLRLEWRSLVNVNSCEGKTFNLREAEEAAMEGNDGSKMDELYFRSCTRRTRLCGLSNDNYYTASISMFDVEQSQWTPWSEPIRFAPIHTMSLFMKNISMSGVLIQWIKRPLNLSDVGNTAPTVVKKYFITTKDHNCGRIDEEILSAPRNSFCFKNLSQGVYSIVMRPSFAYEAMGPSTPPLHIGVVTCKLKVDSVGLDTIAVSWTSLLRPPFSTHHSKASVDVILLRLHEEGEQNSERSTVIELPFEATSYSFAKLPHSTSFKLSGLGVRQLLEVSAEENRNPNPPQSTTDIASYNAPSILEEFGEYAPISVSTKAPIIATVEHFGEDFVNIRFPRVSHDCVGLSSTCVTPALSSKKSSLKKNDVTQTPMGSDLSSTSSSSVVVAKLRGTVSEHAKSGAQEKNTSAPQHEEYLIEIHDKRFLQVREEKLTCNSIAVRGATMMHRITGLTADSTYEIFIRPVLADGSVDQRPQVHSSVTTLSPLVVDVDLSNNQSEDVAVTDDKKRAILRFQRKWRNETVHFKNFIELRISEVPTAPTRKLTGLRSLMSLQKKYFSKRYQVNSTEEVITVNDLPPNAKFMVTARQRSHGTHWNAPIECYFSTGKAAPNISATQ